MDSDNLEKFYVYRSISSGESWGAITINNELYKLPNVNFGMRIFARNETEAIAKGKLNYDKIHIFDSDKENVRRFAATALKTVSKKESCPEIAAMDAMAYAIELNKQYNDYFSSLEEGNDNE